MPTKRDSKGRFLRTKTSFITKSEMRRKTGPAMFDSLRRASAYIRGIARRMIKRSSRPSRPGSPPHTRRGQLKRSIFYAVEGRGVFSKALIGPSFIGVGRVMLAHEYGERFRGQDFDERALMGPALGRARERLPSFWKGSIN